MVKGVIFDLDGVISDTQKLHSRIESALLKRFGVVISPEEITKKYSGVRTRDFFIELLNRQNVECDIDALMVEKWNEMEKAAGEEVDAIAGAIDLIKMFYAMNLPMAVASASNAKYVETVLNALGVKKYFAAIISGDLVKKGKPDPESFSLAAAKINVEPENCLVIEDGVSGMEASKAGGMKCVGFVKNKNSEYPTKNLVLSLAEITEDYLNLI